MKRHVSFALAVFLLAACSKDFGPTAPEGPDSRTVVRAYNELSSGTGGVRTDKDDYVPGETITILGTGWEPGETVVMALTEDPDVQEDLVLTSVADSAGNFVNSEFAVSDIHLGAVFTLSAEGQSSGMTASTMFNDGNLQLQPNPTPNPFSPNADAVKDATTISWRITGSGNETNVTINIRQGTAIGGTLIRQFSIGNKSPGDSGTVVWDGTNASSVVVANGLYTARIFSTGQPESGATGGQRIATLIVDKDAPVISSPAVAPNSLATGSNTPVTVTGTATDTPASGVAASNYKIVSAEFNLDGGAFSAMTAAMGGFNSNIENVSGTIPGATVAGLSAGNHPVCIRATDDAGNRSANNAPSNANCATLTVISPDNAPPTINCTVPDQSSWYADDVIVSCTASDPSGLQNPADAAFSLSTNVPGGTETASAQTDSRQVCDTYGNCATAGPYTFKVDKKAPSTSCGAPDGLWHADDASIGCTATDGGSGVTPSADESFSLETNVPDGTETSNAATGTKTISDLVGNQTTAGPISGNMVDKKAPSTSCDDPDGLWHADDVSIDCTATDGGSGVSPPADESFSLGTNVPDGTETSNAATGTKTVSDAVGNQATAGPVDGNMVDKKAPEIACDAADGAWHATDVSIACTATDGGSGVTPSADESFSLSTNVPDGTETSNAVTGTKTVSDALGHQTTAGPVGGNMVDKKAPSTWCGAPDGLWHADDASIACTATDGGSGVTPSADESFSLETNVPDGTETSNAATGTKTVSDLVGNQTTAGPISGNKVDKKAPSTSCGAPDGLWHADDVSIGCTASDGGSGVSPPADESFSLETNVPDGTETSNAATGTKTVSDLVGHQTTAGPIGGNMVDKKTPEISCQVPGPNFTLNQAPAYVNASASDGGSGPSTQNVSAAASTSSVGVHQVGLSAADEVGNTSNKNCGYSVQYAFSGFYQPVDNLPTMNVAKAGQALPLKWRLQDFFGAPVLSLTLADVEVKTLNCSNGQGTDQVEQYAGASGLQNLGDGYYQYNWKSPKSYVGACKSLNLNLGEGTTHNAFFQFKN